MKTIIELSKEDSTEQVLYSATVNTLFLARGGPQGMKVTPLSLVEAVAEIIRLGGDPDELLNFSATESPADAPGRKD